MTELYDEDYFLRGKETGKSLYENYRWMPELTVPMVHSIIAHLGIQPEHTILDYGCARGYIVRAFREAGYNAIGLDTSEWAIANCDPAVKDFVFGPSKLPAPMAKVDWIIAKDVLEHVPSVADTVTVMLSVALVGVFAVVPLSSTDGDPYIVEDYERDVTHIHRLGLASWVRLFARPGWRVECTYRVPGVKDNYAHHTVGNGFITARRI